jgi:hypothetical protein
LDFAERFRLLDGHLRIARRLWAGEDVDDATLCCGSASSAAAGADRAANGRWIQRAATEFDGWIGSARSTDVATLRQGWPASAMRVAAAWRPTWPLVEPTLTCSTSSTKPVSTTP